MFHSDSKNASSCQEEAMGILGNNPIRGNVFTLAAERNSRETKTTKQQKNRREIYQEPKTKREIKIFMILFNVKFSFYRWSREERRKEKSWDNNMRSWKFTV